MFIYIIESFYIFIFNLAGMQFFFQFQLDRDKRCYSDKL